MSVQVLFAQYAKRNNSTSRFTDHRTEAGGTVVVTELSCFLKEATDSENPIIRIQVNFVPTDFNVCYIYGFNRYYWIRKWEYNRTEWHAYCEIDALATMREEIRVAPFYVLRASNISADIDKYAIDGTYPMKNEIENITTKDIRYYQYDPFNYRFMAGNWFHDPFYDKYDNNGVETLYGNASFGVIASSILLKSIPTSAVINPGLKFGSNTFLMMDRNTSENFISQIFDVNLWNPNAYDKNPIQYIKSAIFIPKKISKPTNITSRQIYAIKLGWSDYSYIGLPLNNPAYLISQEFSWTNEYGTTSNVSHFLYQDDERHVILLDHPQAWSRGFYLNYEPYRTITLVLGNVATLNIPTDRFTIDTNALYIKFRTDLASGKMTIFVYSSKYLTVPNIHFEDSNILICQKTIDISIPLQLTQITSDVDGGTVSAISGAVSGLTGVAMISAGLITGNSLMTIGGAATITNSMANISNGIRTAVKPVASSIETATPSLSSYYIDPYIDFTFKSITNEDLEETGRIVSKTLVINNMLEYPSGIKYHGYLKVLNGDFQSIYTKHEKDIAKSYLESGFFFEE